MSLVGKWERLPKGAVTLSYSIWHHRKVLEGCEKVIKKPRCSSRFTLVHECILLTHFNKVHCVFSIYMYMNDFNTHERTVWNPVLIHRRLHALCSWSSAGTVESFLFCVWGHLIWLNRETLFFYHFLTKILRIISFIEIFSSAGICWKEKEKKSGCVLRCWTIPTKFFNGTDACSVEWVWNGTVRDSLKAQRPLLPRPKIPGCGVNFSFTLIHRNNTDTDVTGTVD